MIKLKITLINSLSLGIILLLINAILQLSSINSRIGQDSLDQIFENSDLFSNVTVNVAFSSDFTK